MLICNSLLINFSSMQRDGRPLFSAPPFDHHQSKPERMIIRLLYNVFIAPFYTTLAACAIFTVYLSATFFVAYLGFKFISGLTSKYTHLLTASDDADIYCAIGINIIMVYKLLWKWKRNSILNY